MNLENSQQAKQLQKTESSVLCVCARFPCAGFPMPQLRKSCSDHAHAAPSAPFLTDLAPAYPLARA